MPIQSDSHTRGFNLFLLFAWFSLLQRPPKRHLFETAVSPGGQAYRCAAAADRTGHAILHTLYGMATRKVHQKPAMWLSLLLAKNGQIFLKSLAVLETRDSLEEGCNVNKKNA